MAQMVATEEASGSVGRSTMAVVEVTFAKLSFQRHLEPLVVINRANVGPIHQDVEPTASELNPEAKFTGHFERRRHDGSPFSLCSGLHEEVGAAEPDVRDQLTRELIGRVGTAPGRHA
jgi:hypothetical protein